ncbi:hypothetical protein EV359DRAFT_87521, partial [Lentinula novae-zelandiae]
MSFPSSSAVTRAPNTILPPVSPPSHPNSAEMTVDATIDELASTLEEPPLGVSLARYIVDNPLWPLLVAAGLPCSFLTAMIRNPAFWVSGGAWGSGSANPFTLPSEQWRDIAAKIEASTNSTVALIELNALDAQDQQELDHLELGEFLRKQPQLPRPSTTSSLPPPIPSGVATPCALAKKRKREVSEPEVAPEVHDCKRKRPVGESQDAEVPDYRRVVLVLRPPLVDTSGLVPLSGDHVGEVVHPPPPSEESGSAQAPLPLSQDHSSDLLGRKWSNSLGPSSRFVPPVVSECRSAVTLKTPPPSQRSRDVPHPFPRAQATAALKVENEALRVEVADLRKLLEASRTETSTLTSLLRDTTTSLDDRNKDLEASRRALQDVAADRLEYGRVLAQFRAIEAELPQAPLEDALTRFHLAVAEVDAYREVAIRQKQELSELRAQVDKEQKRSYEAHEELDAANARAIRLRDRLEDLEETVHRYRTRAHVAEELIWKYPEDEGLYEVDLPSLSSLQNKLTASEVMLRRMATFAHRLHSADPANLLHHHNMYVGGLIELVITLLHPPEQMRTVVELALDYLSQGRLTHGELHLRSTSSLLYYYSNAADRVDGLYQDMFAHSRFSSDEVFLTAAQHAGYVDAHPGSLELPLHRQLFSFDHPIPLPRSPTSDHIPAVPMMDTVMQMWEDMIEAYVREVSGYSASPGRVLPPVEVPSSNDPLPATTSLVADDPRPVL